MKKIYALTFLVAAFGFLWSCGSVDSLQTFSFQYTINYEDVREFEEVPSSGYDTTDLRDYQEYRDNQDKIQKSEVIHFAFWIEDLTYLKDNMPYDFNPEYNIDNRAISFEYVKFWIRFADDAEYSELATFKNVNVADYYRNPYHINEIPDVTREKVLNKFKNNPIYYTKSEYGPITIEDSVHTEKITIPYLKSKSDVVLRFEVDL